MWSILKGLTYVAQVTQPLRCKYQKSMDCIVQMIVTVNKRAEKALVRIKDIFEFFLLIGSLRIQQCGQDCHPFHYLLPRAFYLEMISRFQSVADLK